MDCSSHPETTKEGFSCSRSCDLCEFEDMWSNLTEQMRKISTDEVITNYNEVKTEVLRTMVLFEEGITKNEEKNKGKWVRSTNVSTEYL